MTYKNIIVGSDHAAADMRRNIKKRLEEDNYTVKDMGTDEKVADYPDIAHPVAELISKYQYEVGILLCGSGNGMAMAANKHSGVRAALCRNEEIARLARQHNDANIICLPGRYINNELAYEIIKVFLTTKFEWGRHEKRVQKINK